MKHENDSWLYEAFGRDAAIPEDLSRRLAETYETVRHSGRGKDTISMKKHTRKSARTALLLAAAVAILSISALAVYQYTIRDALLPAAEETTEEPLAASAETQPPTPATEAGDQWLSMSLNGFSDSPEYKAYAEWTAWNDAWWEENPDPWAALGEDDSYFETAENYAYYYSASFSEQAEKLDEILGKYGLTLHTAECEFRTEEELYSILGVEDIFSKELSQVSGYIYDDGSFKAEKVLSMGEEFKTMTVFLAAKGSFSMISGSMPADYQEWTYTTTDGTEVLLALGHADGTLGEPNDPQDRGVILAELEGAYVFAGFTGITDRAELERYADGIGFQVLNTVFAPGADRFHIAAAVEGRHAETVAAMEAQAETMYAPFTDKESRDAAVFADLGHYTVTDLPDGYVFLYDSASWKSEYSMIAWGDTMTDSTFTSGGSTWRGDDSDGTWRFLHLSYQRYYDRHDLETVTNDVEFANAKAYYQAEAKEYAETTVNGYEAILVWDEWNTHYIIWFDTDRGLQFSLQDDAFDDTGNVENFTDAELIAMAESVAGN